MIKTAFYALFVSHSGKPMIPHLLRCQSLAVDDYGFALGGLGSGASSTFAPLGYEIAFSESKAGEKAAAGFFSHNFLQNTIAFLGPLN
jgi:hypothetical protein